VVTLPDWMEQVRNWATTERQPPLAPKTLTDYMQDLNNYVRWTETTLEQPFTPALVTLENVENWKQHELARGRRPNGVNRGLAALRFFAGWMRHTGQTEDYLLDRLAQVPRDQVESFRWLELTEVVQLYRGIRMVPSWNRRRCAMAEALIRVMVEGGLRLDEAASLRIEDIDQEYLHIRAGRAGHSRRVPMGRDLRLAVAAWIPMRESNSPWLFPGSGESRLSAKAISNTIRMVAETGGLQGVTSQTLRVTCGHMLYVKTNDLWVVAALMGHFSADGQPFPGGCVNYVYRPGMEVSTPNLPRKFGEEDPDNDG
jgi:integrase